MDELPVSLDLSDVQAVLSSMCGGKLVFEKVSGSQALSMKGVVFQFRYSALWVNSTCHHSSTFARATIGDEGNRQSFLTARGGSYKGMSVSQLTT